MNSTVKLLGAFVAGAAIGIAAGILIAPDSGRKTRKKLLNESKRLKDQFSDSLTKTVDSMKSSYNKKLDEYAKAGKGALESTRDTLKL